MTTLYTCGHFGFGSGPPVYCLKFRFSGGLASVKRLAFTIVAALVAAGPFTQKLSPDQQVIHVLNRLTFGPRPGDIEQVRRIGVSKWIELQLHPEQIPENPELETKLKSLSTLQMSLAEVVEKYTPAQQDGLAGVVQIASLNTLLSTDQFRKVMNGTAEERTEVLNSLEPDKRKQVLAAIPPNVLAFTPAFKEEAAEAQKMRQEQLRHGASPPQPATQRSAE